MSKNKLDKAQEKRFDEKVNELRRDMGTEKVYEFGYKHRLGDELFVVVDWGNIKQHLANELAKQRQEIENSVDWDKLLESQERLAKAIETIKND